MSQQTLELTRLNHGTGRIRIRHIGHLTALPEVNLMIHPIELVNIDNIITIIVTTLLQFCFPLATLREVYL